MPQFVQNGPNIPESLLQAHEEGRVVFFCGAGISYPARLPGFSGLVDRLYDSLAPIRSAVQLAAIKSQQYDTAVGLLEAKVGRDRVRMTMADILTPDLTSPKSTATHRALLQLGKTRDGRMRLITTNFDRLFEEVIAAEPFSVLSFQAPLLPVPKNRWDGLVYLHGLLSEAPTAAELDRLVISSGDFGLAYLTERWAARFVGELFRNYTVCFVGYSITDPVLRYMMDALAADRLLGESPPEMYAFGSYARGKEETRANEWRAKNVTPILYMEHNRHSHLHKTLHAWAATYRDGVRGKERIVIDSAIARPLASTKQDDFVTRLLWALSDLNGLPAQRFAEFDPVPSLDWLEPLSETRYGHADLSRYGVPPKSVLDKKLSFSMMARPSPYLLAPLMNVVGADGRRSDWDNVMRQLARWLLRHLNDPKLMLWLVKCGGHLHEEMALGIGNRLEELARLESEGNECELERIRASAPNAIPGPKMRTLWRLMLRGTAKVRSVLGQGLYGWCDRFTREGLTNSLRMELRNLLAPRVSLREPYRLSVEEANNHKPHQLRDLVEWEIVLSTEHVHACLKDLLTNDRWAEALPVLLPDFTALLRDALDLMRELGAADEKRDRTYMQQPSIGMHPQNNDYNDWTALIDLTRDAWLAAAATMPRRAALEASIWWSIPYPLFKRLAFFAAAKGDVVATYDALDWLLADNHWWLWSVETERESTMLLVALAQKGEPAMGLKLEQAIISGPPRTMYDEQTEPERLSRILSREVWQRLAMFVEAGAVLSPIGQQRLDALDQKFPEWALEQDQVDEFPFGTSNGDEWRKFVATPRRRRELVSWLKQHPGGDFFQKDDWRDRCRDNFPATACALWALGQEDHWPIHRWHEALQAWSEGKLAMRAWRCIAPVLANAPNDALKPIARSVSSWLKDVAKTFVCHDREFFSLGQRILAFHSSDAIEEDDPVFRAINHPVGHVVEAFLHWWYRGALHDGQGLPAELKPTFTNICDSRIETFRHGRILLAAHVITLFRVDPDWVIEHLLPHFDWSLSRSEGRTVWQGFLWSPRLYRPLIEALKPAFLDTGRHYAELGKHGGQYVSLLTFAALDPRDTFTTFELAGAIHALPPEGLRYAANALVNALKGAGDQRLDYWVNRVAPYINKLWPKDQDIITPAIAEVLSRLCVAAGDAFPLALAILRRWLQPLAHPAPVVRMLCESGLSQKFPEEALTFLSLLIDEQIQWLPPDLSTCLEAIRSASPVLETDQRFEKIRIYLRIIRRE
ncbi:SIR2 family protein [Pseudomonas syringae pv. actinidiae]|nr:anti-phage defense-associated sirtuin Dsr1 [Pseudomonas syringae]WCE89389.1 SIR2 family protein [Pseudomonas syringae pv. actinidiae]